LFYEKIKEMRKYKGTRIDGTSYERDIEDIFDPEIPDVETKEPTTETVIGEDGLPYESTNHHYDGSANHHKVSESIWDHFNDMGKAIINHNFGQHADEVLYQHWADKMTIKEWMELKMWMLTQSLWYIDFLQVTSPTTPTPSE
jgi:hypothetical protein